MSVQNAWQEMLTSKGERTVEAVAPVQRVTLTRERIYPAGGGGYRRQWRWLYSYQLDALPATIDGTTLADLVRRMKRQHPQAEIVKAWEA